MLRFVCVKNFFLPGPCLSEPRGFSFPTPWGADL